MVEFITGREQRILERKIKGVLEKEAEEKVKKRKKGVSAIFRPGKKRRPKVGMKLVGALVTAAKAVAKPVGRPKKSYKYGMPVAEYKKLQARKRALYQIYKQEEVRQLSRRGLTRRQIQTAQTVRTLEQPRTPTSVADDELAFRKFLAKRTISPNTQAILTRLRRTQLKAQSDDVEMQRRLKERKMVASAGSLLNTPFIFKDHQMDLTGVNEENILKAPSVFKENPEENILRSKRLNIVQTREAGNSLNFF